jgi:tetratricopeptide (TPR) repeat protein
MKSSFLCSKPSAFFLSFLSSLCPLGLCGEMRADELNKPYDLTIVVHVAENRLLTDVFRKRIQRDLHDGFQAALGDMGHVTVTDKHPRLADVLARGLHSLDDWKDRDDKKTHFVLIDYSGVHYEIQTRQYDGTIGRASPVVRRDRTRDRDFVAKAAALLIKKDFGVLGTVRTEPEGAKKTVTIELRGGALGDMRRWVKKGDVFALAPPDGSKPLALKWSLLQVEQAPAEDARNGLCVCRFFNRYQVRGGIAGYRCIKLGAVEAPLRIRWMQQMPGGRLKPLDRRLTVDIRRYGFDGEESSKLQNSSDLNGVLEAVDEKGKIVLFNNVAFVRVIDGLGNATPPQVPVALVDDQPVLIEVNPSKDFNSVFSIQKSDWQTRVAASVQTQVELFRSLERLAANPANRAESIAVAASGMKRAKKDRADLLKEKEELLREHKDLKTPIEDRRIQQLEEYEKALAEFIAKQQQIEKTENDPQRKKWLSEIERAKLLEKELEYDKALEIYERIRQEGYQDADLDKHVEKVRKDWAPPRNKEHEEARGFIYRVWPTLDISRLEEKLPAARDAFKKCKDADDFISIGKLLKGTEGHADRLRKKLEELRPDLIIDDEKEAQQLKKVSEQIAKLGEDIQDYLKARAGAK